MLLFVLFGFTGLLPMVLWWFIFCRLVCFKWLFVIFIVCDYSFGVVCSFLVWCVCCINDCVFVLLLLCR